MNLLIATLTFIASLRAHTRSNKLNKINQNVFTYWDFNWRSLMEFSRVHKPNNTSQLHTFAFARLSNVSINWSEKSPFVHTAYDYKFNGMRSTDARVKRETIVPPSTGTPPIRTRKRQCTPHSTAHKQRTPSADSSR